MKLPSLKNIAWGQKRWKIMNYDIFSIFVFSIIFVISLVAYSNDFFPNQFSGNETLILNDLAAERNFTLKKWNCEHPLGKCPFFLDYGLIGAGRVGADGLMLLTRCHQTSNNHFESGQCLVKMFGKTSLLNRWQWCLWQHYVGDFMMVTDLRCLRQNHYVGDFISLYWWFFQCIKQTVTNILNLSPTHFVANIRHQHVTANMSARNQTCLI